MWIGVRERTGRVIDLFWDDLTLYLESVVFDAKDSGWDPNGIRHVGLIFKMMNIWVKGPGVSPSFWIGADDMLMVEVSVSQCPEAW